MMWYKKYGWQKNPFLVKPSNLLVGLENERENLKVFASSENTCLLRGPTGSGKTSLLLWLQEEVKKTHTPVYINCIKTNKKAELITQLKEHKRLLDKLLFRHYPKNTVLALDEAQASPQEASEFIKVLWDEGSINSVVLASTDKELSNFSESFKDRIGERVIELTKLTKSEAIDLVKLRVGDNNPFDGDALEKIVELSGYNPRKILEICEKTCKSCAEKGGKTINRADIEELVSQISVRLTKLVRPPEKVGILDKQRLVSQEGKLVKPVTKLTKSVVSGAVSVPSTKPRGFSPLQATLVRLLEEGSKTMADISATTGSSIGTIGKQLSVLRSKNIVNTVENTRPKKYFLRGKEPSVKKREIDIAQKILDYLGKEEIINSMKAVPKDLLLSGVGCEKEVFAESVKSLESSGKIIVTNDEKVYLVKL